MIKNKFFDKGATITTKNNKKYNIRKLRIYVGGKINYYGKQYVITPEDKEDNAPFRIIDEVYSLDNYRFRFLSDVIKNPVIFDTIEYSSDHSEERPIKVISDYDDVTTEINSIPEIVKFDSDLIVYEKDKIYSKTNDNSKKKSGGLFKLTLKNSKRDAI